MTLTCNSAYIELFIRGKSPGGLSGYLVPPVSATSNDPLVLDRLYTCVMCVLHIMGLCCSLWGTVGILTSVIILSLYAVSCMVAQGCYQNNTE